MSLILGFSLPLLVGMLFQQFYSLVDTIIVGKFLGVDALAAVGSTGAINFLIIGFCMGVCSGFAIPVAQRFGAGDYESLRCQQCLALPHFFCCHDSDRLRLLPADPGTHADTVQYHRSGILLYLYHFCGYSGYLPI